MLFKALPRLICLSSLASALLFLTVPGCFTQRAPEIAGTVIASSTILGSNIGPLTRLIPAGYVPVPDAVAYIAQTSDPEFPLPGFETKTDKDGSYEINLANIQPSTGDGYYCLVVKKNGYEPLIYEKLMLGTASHYIRNTVALKPLNKKDQPHH